MLKFEFRNGMIWANADPVEEKKEMGEMLENWMVTSGNAQIEADARAFEAYEERLPKCQICGDTIDDKWCINLDMDGAYVHRDCLRAVCKYLPDDLKWVWYEMAETIENTDSYQRTPSREEDW